MSFQRGPGAGIAIAASGLAILVSIVLAVVGILLWPIRFLVRLITRKRPQHPPRVRRAVVGPTWMSDRKASRRGGLPAGSTGSSCRSSSTRPDHGRAPHKRAGQPPA